MDRTDWPWSWEEEIKWKADLEERDFEFFQELIDNAVEDGTADLHLQRSARGRRFLRGCRIFGVLRYGLIPRRQLVPARDLDLRSLRKSAIYDRIRKEGDAPCRNRASVSRRSEGSSRPIGR